MSPGEAASIALWIVLYRDGTLKVRPETTGAAEAATSAASSTNNAVFFTFDSFRHGTSASLHNSEVRKFRSISGL